MRKLQIEACQEDKAILYSLRANVWHYAKRLSYHTS